MVFLHVLFTIGGSCTTEKLQNLDVRWHLKSYKLFKYNKTVDTAEGKFANLMDIEGESFKSIPIEDISESSQQTPQFTHSNAPIYDKSHCFFCDLPGRITSQLRHISYDSSSVALRSALELSRNDVWRVQLSECINQEDAHAMDVLYHTCY